MTDESKKSKASRCNKEVGHLQQSPLVSPRGKKVRFDSNVNVQEVPHRRDISDEEANSIWYCQEEFDVIKTNLLATLRLIVSNEPIGDDMCARGLECRTPEGARNWKQNKLRALRVVWSQQVKQWKLNVVDEDAITRVCREETYKSKEKARRKGLEDEMEARRGHQIGLNKSLHETCSICRDKIPGRKTAGNILSEPLLLLPSAA